MVCKLYVVTYLEVYEPLVALLPHHAGWRDILHVETANDGDAWLGRRRPAVTVGEVQRPPGDVAAVWLVQHQRRCQVASVGGVLHPDPSSRVNRSVVVEERDPGVVRLTFCGTPRFGTTMTPRSASYEQLSAE